MTTISVILPAFRAEPFLQRAVRSIQAQTITDWEVVIASDDGRDYLGLLKDEGIDDERLRCVGTGGFGTGLASTRNCAIEAARGRVIVCLDADDALLPTHLETMVPRALEHGVAISQIRLLHHPSGRLLPNRAKPAPEGVLPLEEIYPACLHAYAAIAFDRTAIGRRWNVTVPLLEDAVFLAEASSERPAIWYSPEPLYAYYHRGDSLCNAPGSAARFLRAGAIVLGLLERGELLLSDHAARVLRTYITRNNAIEQAFAHAVESGAVRDYQDFLGKSQHVLHRPLLKNAPMAEIALATVPGRRIP